MTFIRYVDCPKCKKTAELRTTTIRIKLSDIELKQREMVKIMVKYLLGSNAPLIKFPATSRPETNCHHCDFQQRIWGWTSRVGGKIIISFPRQTFFLPRDEFTDTIVHEPAHFLISVIENNSLPKHGKKWYFQYRENREKLFEEYQEFINSSEAPPIKYHKSYRRLYTSRYKNEYERIASRTDYDKKQGNLLKGEEIYFRVWYRKRNFEKKQILKQKV